MQSAREDNVTREDSKKKRSLKTRLFTYVNNDIYASVGICVIRTYIHILFFGAFARAHTPAYSDKAEKEGERGL